MAVRKVGLKKKEPAEKAEGFKIPESLKRRQVFIPLIIVVLGGILFLLKGFFIAAIVNGRPITRFEVISELEERSGKQALSSLVIQTLIFQEAGKKGITVGQKEIDDAVKLTSDSLSKQGQNLDQALAFQGLSRKDFIQQVRIQKIIDKIFADKTNITDKEVADYIEKNKSTMPADMKPEDAKKAVAEQLKQQKLSTLVQPWIQDLQKKAKILYLVNY